MVPKVRVPQGLAGAPAAGETARAGSTQGASDRMAEPIASEQTSGALAELRPARKKRVCFHLKGTGNRHLDPSLMAKTTLI